MSDNLSPGIPRREALKRMATVATAAASVPSVELSALAQPTRPLKRSLTDPDLVSPAPVPWEKTLSKDELRTASALCDVIIPADDTSPSASKVGVAEFLDDWISAPYPAHKDDAIAIRGGLTWLNMESNKRFSKDFADLTDDQKHQICDDISFLPKAKPEFQAPAHFFKRFRDLTAGGFYTSKEGIKDLKYVGNVPTTKFEGPPKEVLERLKLV